MTRSHPSPAARAARVRDRLEQLFALGSAPHANRPGLGADEQRACELAAGWMRDAGLSVAWDAAGNLVGRRAGRDPSRAEVWLGSHLDTVPAGGRFDGALGVVAAIEAIESLPAPPAAGIALWAFRDEEGWRFGRSCFGSRALCGALEPGELDGRDAGGVSVGEALRALGHVAPPPEGWLEPRPAAHLELHIEQGPVLAEAGVPLGVVIAIAGIAEGSVRFHGRRGHAGTTPMAGRADALRAASAYVEGVATLAESLEQAVATVGHVAVRPGAQNVIPDEAELSLDLRAAGDSALRALRDGARRLAGEAAAAHGCRAEFELRWTTPPVPMDHDVRAVLRDAVARAGAPVLELPSGAGHDAGVLAAAGIPTGMLFVRSLAGGISHAPEEDSATGDVAVALTALADALGALTG